MKKMIIIVAVVLLCLLGALTQFSCNKGKGKGFQENGSSEPVTPESETSVAEAKKITEKPEPEEPRKDVDGGEYWCEEEEMEEVKMYSVLINRNDYFYENTPITFEEVISMFETFRGDLIVEVTDNNATHKAYIKLVNKLEELKIPIIEKSY